MRINPQVAPTNGGVTGSILWKALVLAFPVVGYWLVWKVGKGYKVRIGADPWSVSGFLYRLPWDFIVTLQNQGAELFPDKGGEGICRLFREQLLIC